MHVSEFLKNKKKATEYDINYDSVKINQLRKQLKYCLNSA